MLNDRRKNQSVYVSEEITLSAGETKVIDFKLYEGGKYAIGVDFNNIQIQNFGDDDGNNTQNLLVNINQNELNKIKIRKNFIYKDTGKNIRSLKLTNVSTTQPATFDIFLDNDDNQIDVLKQIKNLLEKK